MVVRSKHEIGGSASEEGIINCTSSTGNAEWMRDGRTITENPEADVHQRKLGETATLVVKKKVENALYYCLDRHDQTYRASVHLYMNNSKCNTVVVLQIIHIIRM